MVLSEEKLKVKYRKKPFSIFEIEKGTLLTPSAKQFIAEKNIELVIIGGEKNKKNFKEISSSEKIEVQENISEKFKYFGLNGEYYDKKPEYMTQINGNILVLKNNKKIMFKAKLELFLSEILLLSKELEILNVNEKLQKDMNSIIKFMNNILIAETLGQILENQELLEGYPLEKIQEIARNPKEELGISHLIEINLNSDILIHKLNRLKFLARELETYAVDYFINEGQILRKDLLHAFNVLSSVIYIIILKADKGEYRK